MSVLQECGLDLGKAFFMRWDVADSESPLVSTVITKAELLEDMSPARVRVLVVRRKTSARTRLERYLEIRRHGDGQLPVITFQDSGEPVVDVESQPTCAGCQQYREGHSKRTF